MTLYHFSRFSGVNKRHEFQQFPWKSSVILNVPFTSQCCGLCGAATISGSTSQSRCLIVFENRCIYCSRMGVRGKRKGIDFRAKIPKVTCAKKILSNFTKNHNSADQYSTEFLQVSEVLWVFFMYTVGLLKHRNSGYNLRYGGVGKSSRMKVVPLSFSFSYSRAELTGYVAHSSILSPPNIPVPGWPRRCLRFSVSQPCALWEEKLVGPAQPLYGCSLCWVITHEPWSEAVLSRDTDKVMEQISVSKGECLSQKVSQGTL